MNIINWIFVKRQEAPEEEQWRRYVGCDDLPAHRRSDTARVIRAAEVAEARRSGRWLGERITARYRRGESSDGDRCARWLERHGDRNGVPIENIVKQKNGLDNGPR